MKRILFFLTLLFSLFTAAGFAKGDNPIEQVEVDESIIIDRIGNADILVTIPSPIFSFTEAEIKLKFINPRHTKLLLNKNRIEFLINGESRILDFVNGEASFKHRFNESKKLSIYTEEFSFSKTVTVYPLWAIIVPLIVIMLYILKRLLTKKS